MNKSLPTISIKPAPSVERVVTSDGSATLVRADGVSYRSVHGAVTEAQYVYVEPTQKSGDRRILELGFGGATNFCETVRALEPGVALTYVSIEEAPVTPDCVVGVGPGRDMAAEALDLLRDQPVAVVESGPIRLVVVGASWQQANEVGELEDLRVDAVYHDPFAVSANPDCWTEACFAWELEHAAADAKLVTYGAASSTRRAMVAAGWEVATRTGTLRKREVTIAARLPESLEGYRTLTQKYR